MSDWFALLIMGLCIFVLFVAASSVGKDESWAKDCELQGYHRVGKVVYKCSVVKP